MSRCVQTFDWQCIYNVEKLNSLWHKYQMSQSVFCGASSEIAPDATILQSDFVWPIAEKNKKSQQIKIPLTSYTHAHTLSEHFNHPNQSRFMNAWPSKEYSCIHPTIASQHHGLHDSICWVILFKTLTIRNTVRELHVYTSSTHTHTRTQKPGHSHSLSCVPSS